MAVMSLSPTRRIFWASLLAALLTVVVLAACASATPPEPSGQSTAAPPQPSATAAPPTSTPLPRGGNLTIRLAADIPDLRPWQPRSRGEEQLISVLYSGLMRLDDQLRPQPDLAERWEATADGRTLTFTLRSGLSWHDGAPLDAGDVLFTLDRLRSLPPTSTALLADLRYITAATAPTSDTVVLSLSGRYAPILSMLAVPILPRHLLEGASLSESDLWETPVGSGPFQLVERRPGESLVLDRFEAFHRGAPLLDRVVFVVSPDPTVAFGALEAGQLLLAELPWALQEPVAAIAGVRSAGYPENGAYFLGFNLRQGRPFADRRVRQALALAIDLPRLVAVATKGQGQPIGSSALPGSWADLTPAPAGSTDLDTARALLDEAGWTLPEGSTIRQREGITLTVELLVRADDERRLVAARSIAEVAARVGMQLNVQPADFPTILSKYAPPYSFDLLLGSWSNGAGDPGYADVAYYDPDDFALFHSSQLNQGGADSRATRNFVGFNDAAYDNQAQAARQLYNLDERRSALIQAQARIAAELPYLYLWADRLPVGLSERVTTLDGPVNLASPWYLWNIERWYLQ